MRTARKGKPTRAEQMERLSRILAQIRGSAAHRFAPQLELLAEEPGTSWNAPVELGARCLAEAGRKP